MSKPASLESTWEMIRAELDGEEAPDFVALKTELELATGAYAVRFAGRTMDRGTFEAGARGTLQTLVLRGTEGPNAGRHIRCIYQLVGDRLRVCYGLDGVEPTAFATAAGQNRYLATYRRKAP